MSLITRCPVCGTMFKVVPDQLRVSEGWVRCGHCTEVFDATASMQNDAQPQAEMASPEAIDHATGDAIEDAPSPEPEPEPAPESAPEPEAEAEPAAVAAPPPTESPVAVNPVALPSESEPASDYFLSSAIHTEVPEDLADDVPDSEQLLEHEQLLREHALDQPFALRRADRADEADDDEHDAAEVPVVGLPAPLEREPELHDLSFVREARRKEFWNTPTVRAILGLLLVVLSALLVVQYAVHHRDRLAAADPGLRPWLMGLCEPFRCTIRPPRQIESIAIDNSTFNKLAGDTYRLDVTVKNQAATPSAVPALELTLTDAQDRPVIRRVLLPADIAPGTTVIGPRGDWSTSVALAVAAEGATGRIAGYRVIAFYP